LLVGLTKQVLELEWRWRCMSISATRSTPSRVATVGTPVHGTRSRGAHGHGPAAIDVPQRRDSSFDPQTVRRDDAVSMGWTRWSSSRTAKGQTTSSRSRPTSRRCTRRRCRGRRSRVHRPGARARSGIGRTGRSIGRCGPRWRTGRRTDAHRPRHQRRRRLVPPSRSRQAVKIVRARPGVGPVRRGPLGFAVAARRCAGLRRVRRTRRRRRPCRRGCRRRWPCSST
jgi:hypothetical protein